MTGTLVFEAWTKLEILRATAHAIHAHKIGPSRQAFLDLCGINEATARGIRSSSRITESVLDKLISVVAFDPSDPSWIDPAFDERDRLAYFNAIRTRPAWKGRDTPDLFKSMLRRRHGLGGAEGVRVTSLSPEFYNRRLLSFELEPATNGVEDGDAPLPFLLSLIAGRGVVDLEDSSTLIFRLRRVYLQLVFGPGQAMFTSTAAAATTRVELRNAVLKHRGLRQSPGWALEAVDVLHDLYVTSEPALCSIAGARPGDKFEAEVFVDCSETDSITLDGGHDLLPATQLVLKRLWATAHDHWRAEDNWLRLGRQTIRFDSADV